MSDTLHKTIILYVFYLCIIDLGAEFCIQSNIGRTCTTIFFDRTLIRCSIPRTKRKWKIPNYCR